MYANSQSGKKPTPGGAGTPECPVVAGLPPEAIARVAAHFRALSEPMRLRLLDLLRDGERPVGELARACGSTVANVSRHLALLRRHGLVASSRHGTSVSYRLADPAVSALCDRVCAAVAHRLAREGREEGRLGRLLSGAPADAGPEEGGASRGG